MRTLCTCEGFEESYPSHERACENVPTTSLHSHHPNIYYAEYTNEYIDTGFAMSVRTAARRVAAAQAEHRHRSKSTYFTAHSMRRQQSLRGMNGCLRCCVWVLCVEDKDVSFPESGKLYAQGNITAYRISNIRKPLALDTETDQVRCIIKKKLKKIV